MIAPNHRNISDTGIFRILTENNVTALPAEQFAVVNQENKTPTQPACRCCQQPLATTAKICASCEKELRSLQRSFFRRWFR